MLTLEKIKIYYNGFFFYKRAPTFLHNFKRALIFFVFTKPPFTNCQTIQKVTILASCLLLTDSSS